MLIVMVGRFLFFFSGSLHPSSSIGPWTLFFLPNFYSENKTLVISQSMDLALTFCEKRTRPLPTPVSPSMFPFLITIPWKKAENGAALEGVGRSLLGEISGSDGHSRCCTCLDEEHIVETCEHCACFSHQTKKNRATRLQHTLLLATLKAVEMTITPSQSAVMAALSKEASVSAQLVLPFLVGSLSQHQVVRPLRCPVNINQRGIKSPKETNWRLKRHLNRKAQSPLCQSLPVLAGNMRTLGICCQVTCWSSCHALPHQHQCYPSLWHLSGCKAKPNMIRIDPFGLTLKQCNKGQNRTWHTPCHLI